MMAEPGGHKAAAVGGCGRLRTSYADRERVIEVLKVAFVQACACRRAWCTTSFYGSGCVSHPRCPVSRLL